MKVAIIEKPESVELIERDYPVMQPDEVIVKIVWIGLCGTDLNIYKGNMPLVSFPRVPGHEVSGVIVEKGNDVPAEMQIGDAVTLNPYTSCGKCSACRQGRVNTCKYNQTLGVQRDGAMAAFVSVPYKKVLRSSKLTAKEFALVEPLSVGYHAANRGRVKEGDTVLVMGCGMIGIGAILACLRKKATVIAMDVDDDKLEFIKSLGVDLVINGAKENALERINSLTNNEGVSVCIEAVGAAVTFQLALSACAFAGRVVFIGYAKAEISFDTSLIVKKELDIMGSRNALNEFETVIEMIEEKQFPFEKLISSVYPVENVGEAFEHWKNHPNQVIKLLTSFQ